MRLYVVEGWTASNHAIEILEAAGIQFDKISICGDAKTLSDYYNDLGISIFPTLTMFGYCYKGLAKIEAFINKELKDREVIERCADESYYAADG